MDPAITISGPDTRVAADRSSPWRWLRLGVLMFLLVMIAVGAFVVFGTEQGARFRDIEQLQAMSGDVRAWVANHQALFLVAFVAAYVVCAVLLLPVWWLQIVAGFAYGLAGGVTLAMAGSTAGALATAAVSAWLGEEFVRTRIIGDGKAARRLAGIVAALGRNGLLVVFICRLSYPVPYGVSNYLFGLTSIKLRDIAIGTAFGGIPVYAGWVAAGARPDWVTKWEFWAIVIGVNLLLLTPLLIRPIRHAVRTWKRSKAGGTRAQL